MLLQLERFAAIRRWLSAPALIALEEWSGLLSLTVAAIATLSCALQDAEFVNALCPRPFAVCRPALLNAHSSCRPVCSLPTRSPPHPRTPLPEYGARGVWNVVCASRMDGQISAFTACGARGGSGDMRGLLGARPQHALSSPLLQFRRITNSVPDVSPIGRCRDSAGLVARGRLPRTNAPWVPAARGHGW